MKLLTFGSYDEYRQAQIAANRLKFRKVFAQDQELQRIAAHFQSAVAGAARGLCHGVRNGYEVQLLRRLLPSVDITGTDISDTAAGLPHCIVWDMHEVKSEWVNAIDFMYSNSWDHSYDPTLLFSRWASCLSQRGRLYLAYTELHSEKGATEDTKYDVFGCSLDELISILQRAFVLEDVIEVAPRMTRSSLRKKLEYLRAGQLSKVLRTPLSSRRVLVIVLRKRMTTPSQVTP